MRATVLREGRRSVKTAVAGEEHRPAPESARRSSPQWVKTAVPGEEAYRVGATVLGEGCRPWRVRAALAGVRQVQSPASVQGHGPATKAAASTQGPLRLGAVYRTTAKKTLK